MSLTKKEKAAFDGLEESYRDMDRKTVAPKCHFTPMTLEERDYEIWRECRHCGSTKEVGMMDRPH